MHRRRSHARSRAVFADARTRMPASDGTVFLRSPHIAGSSPGALPAPDNRLCAARSPSAGSAPAAASRSPACFAPPEWHDASAAAKRSHVRHSRAELRRRCRTPSLGRGPRRAGTRCPCGPCHCSCTSGSTSPPAGAGSGRISLSRTARADRQSPPPFAPVPCLYRCSGAAEGSASRPQHGRTA